MACYSSLFPSITEAIKERESSSFQQTTFQNTTFQQTTVQKLLQQPTTNKSHQHKAGKESLKTKEEVLENSTEAETKTFLIEKEDKTEEAKLAEQNSLLPTTTEKREQETNTRIQTEHEVTPEKETQFFADFFSLSVKKFEVLTELINYWMQEAETAENLINVIHQYQVTSVYFNKIFDKYISYLGPLIL